MGLEQRGEPGLRVGGVFHFGVGHVHRFHLATFGLGTDRLQSLPGIFLQAAGTGHLFEGGLAPDQRGVNFANRGGLDGQKMSGGQVAFGLGLGNGALILIEQGQGDRQTQTPLVVTGAAGIPSVARSEMDIRPLIGDFQLKRGLAGGIGGEGAADIRPIQQGPLPSFRRGQGPRKLVQSGKRKMNGLERARRHAECHREARSRLTILAGGGQARELGRVPRAAGGGDVVTREAAGGELAGHQADDIALRHFLPCQQGFRFTRLVKTQQGRPHAPARLPDGTGQIPAGRLGKMTRLRHAVTPLAGGLDGPVKTDGHEPRTGVVGDAHVISGGDRHRRIGALGRRGLRCLHRP